MQMKRFNMPFQTMRRKVINSNVNLTNLQDFAIWIYSKSFLVMILELMAAKNKRLRNVLSVLILVKVISLNKLITGNGDTKVV